MELMIITYSLAIPLGLFFFMMPFRLVLMVVDIPRGVLSQISYKTRNRKWKRLKI